MNEKLFSNLIPAFLKYLNDGITNPTFSDYGIIGLVIIAVGILVIVILKYQEGHKDLGRLFQIYRIGIISAYCVAVVFIAYCINLWNQGLYKTSVAELWDLLALVAILVIPIYCFSALRNNYTRETINNVIGHPLTPTLQANALKLARRQFARLKWYVLIPALGFLMLLLVQEPYNLISIVLDNSASMETPLENGKQALSETFSDLNEKTHIIITTFEDSENMTAYKTTLASMRGMSKSERLKGLSHFESSNEAAIDYMSSIQTLKQQTSNSPVCEAILQNHLFAQEQIVESDVTYEGIVGVIVTDGGENYITDGENEIKQLFCNSGFFEATFQELFFIDINKYEGDDSSGKLFQAIMDCDYDILPGGELNSYVDSLGEIFQDIKKDWYFIYWLAIIYILLGVVAILIQPKKLL